MILIEIGRNYRSMPHLHQISAMQSGSRMSIAYVDVCMNECIRMCNNAMGWNLNVYVCAIILWDGTCIGYSSAHVCTSIFICTHSN